MEVSQRTIVAMNIYDYCQQSGLTQREIAKRAGISKSTLSAYVTGKNYPQPEQMKALADVFGVSVGDLTSAPYDKVETINLDANPEVKELVQIALQLPSDYRKFVTDLARNLLAKHQNEKFGST